MQQGMKPTLRQLEGNMLDVFAMLLFPALLVVLVPFYKRGRRVRDEL